MRKVIEVTKIDEFDNELVFEVDVTVDVERGDYDSPSTIHTEVNGFQLVTFNGDENIPNAREIEAQYDGDSLIDGVDLMESNKRKMTLREFREIVKDTLNESSSSDVDVFKQKVINKVKGLGKTPEEATRLVKANMSKVRTAFNKGESPNKLATQLTMKDQPVEEGKQKK